MGCCRLKLAEKGTGMTKEQLDEFIQWLEIERRIASRGFNDYELGKAIVYDTVLEYLRSVPKL